MICSLHKQLVGGMTTSLVSIEDNVDMRDEILELIRNARLHTMDGLMQAHGFSKSRRAQILRIFTGWYATLYTVVALGTCGTTCHRMEL